MHSHLCMLALTASILAPAHALAPPTGLAAVAQRSSLDVYGMRFGRSVLTLTDLDGDGVREFAVGAPTAAPDADDRERHTDHAGAVIVLSGATREVVQVWRGERDRPTFGHRLRPLTDVDGDGVPDVLVGYEFSARTEVRSGVDGALHLALDRAFDEVFEMGDVDRDAAPDFLLHTGRTCEVRSGRDGSYITESCSVETNARLSAVGDLDGDGLTDFLSAGKKSEWLMSALPEPELSRKFTLFYFKDRIDAGPRSSAPWGALGPWAVAHPVDGGWIAVRQERSAGVALMVVDPGDEQRRFEIVGGSTQMLEPKNWLGYALVTAGEVDADGVEDFVVASASNVRACSGGSGEEVWSWSAPFELQLHGVSLCAFGDADGDGITDVLVGAAEEHWHGPVWRNGAVRLLSGESGEELWSVTEAAVDGRFPRREK